MLQLSCLRIKNFRSINYTDMPFIIDTPGLKFLSGENKKDSKLGANGAGKSSVWDALVWCFYGTTSKGVRTSNIISWGKEDVEVTVDFIVDSIMHSLTRTAPPNRILLDSVVSTQQDVDTLLHLSKERFLHSVVFGQGERLFPDLSIGERGELLDSVLDLQLWSRCSEEAGVQQTGRDMLIKSNKDKLSFIEGQLAETGTLANLQLKEKEWQYAHEARIEWLENQAFKWSEEKEQQIEAKVNALDTNERERLILEISSGSIISTEYESDLSDAVSKATNAESEAVRVQNRLEKERDELRKTLEFWRINHSCPVCMQSITESARIKSIADHTDLLKLVEADLLESKITVSTLHEKTTKILSNQAECRAERIRLEEKKKHLNSISDKLDSEARILIEELDRGNPYLDQLTKMKIEVNPWPAEIVLWEAKIDTLVHDKETAIANLAKNEALSTAASYWKHGFKRIRLTLVTRILAALGIEVQSALSALGLDSWQVRFSTETETKSGTTKLGVQIAVIAPDGVTHPWDNFSGGEAQRLRLAIAMGLASMIQRSAGMKFDFEVWDEPTTWLGSEGVEDLLDALAYRAEVLKKNIWVIDHRALQSTSFDEIWIVQKTEEGSSISRYTETA